MPSAARWRSGRRVRCNVLFAPVRGLFRSGAGAWRSEANDAAPAAAVARAGRTGPAGIQIQFGARGAARRRRGPPRRIRFRSAARRLLGLRGRPAAGDCLFRERRHTGQRGPGDRQQRLDAASPRRRHRRRHGLRRVQSSRRRDVHHLLQRKDLARPARRPGVHQRPSGTARGAEQDRRARADGAL